ncbi:MAG: hypothetical protein LC776_13045 [Acidobacteria bacterium]|nr:hypothetical protein [Acidobacteriota bacterium]
MRGTAYLAAVLLTLLGVAGGSVLPVASSRSLISGRETGQSYAEPLSRPLSQASAGRIVFNKSGPQAEGIFIMDADGTNVRQLSRSGFEPAFSLDGTKVAFVSGQPPSGCNNNELNLMPSIFGTDQRPLTNVCGYDQHPAWSPDGTKLAFWSDRDAGEGLYVMNSDGSNQMLVLSTSSIQRLIEGPHWSPDGTRIAFEGYNLNANNEADIFVVNADGSNPTNITNTPTAEEYSPAWSRDSAKISFSKLNGNSSTGFTSGDIWVMNATGDNQVKLTNAANNVFNTKPTWSPDNTRIAFASNPGNGNAEIYVMNADGSGQMNLSNSPGNDYYPDWQVAAPAPTTNPIDNTEFFVRQQYFDFLNRAPDAAGLQFWTNNINSCGTDAGCREVKRIDTSAAYFLSIEFQGTGYLVYLFYKASFPASAQRPRGLPRMDEFLPDTQQIGQGVVVGQDGWEARLEANKVAYANQLVERPQFTAKYPRGMTAAQFVDALNQNTGGSLTQAERDALVGGLTTGAETRATALRKVAENEEFTRREFNSAFVLMQYFGYLRRNPNDAPDNNFDGYDFWLAKLNQFGGDFRRADMVKAFITSGEYRGRFGNRETQIISRRLNRGTRPRLREGV